MTEEQTAFLFKLFKGSMSTKDNKSSPVNILKVFGTVKLTSEEVAKVNKLFN